MVISLIVFARLLSLRQSFRLLLPFLLLDNSSDKHRDFSFAFNHCSSYQGFPQRRTSLKASISSASASASCLRRSSMGLTAPPLLGSLTERSAARMRGKSCPVVAERN